MANAVEITEPLIPNLRPVPPAGPGICRVCRSGPNAGFAICHSCSTTMRQVRRPTQHVVPITLYEKDTQIHHVLKGYKRGLSPQAVGRFSTEIAATLSRFVANHEPCLTSLIGDTFTLTTTVPSTRREARPGVHPLVDVVGKIRRLVICYRPVLERGLGATDHNLANDEAFRANQRIDGARVLLLDDTFTTGARLQSAASVLAAAGAASVTAVVIGRVIDSAWNENCSRIWQQAITTEFDFGCCCLCAGRTR